MRGRLALAVAIVTTDSCSLTAAQNSLQPLERAGRSDLSHYIHAVPHSPADYQAITADQRLAWFTRSTVGSRSLTAGLFSAGFGTATNSPHEYGTHWEGFAQRYGMRLTGVVTSNAIEASLGAVWGEDPRYFHTVDASFGQRAKNVLDLTFRAYRPDGQRHPAYARFVAMLGNNFLSDTWRVPSDATWQRSLIRTAEGFGARAVSNAVSEFVPQVWRTLRHKPVSDPVFDTHP